MYNRSIGEVASTALSVIHPNLCARQPGALAFEFGVRARLDGQVVVLVLFASPACMLLSFSGAREGGLCRGLRPAFRVPSMFLPCSFRGPWSRMVGGGKSATSVLGPQNGKTTTGLSQMQRTATQGPRFFD